MATQQLIKNCHKLLKTADHIHVKVPWGYVRGFQVGPKDGAPVLMVHGWLDNCHSFVPLLTELPMNRRYIALDLPGHGHSSHKPTTAYSHTIDFIVDLEHIRRELGIDDMTVIGHSLGGMLSGIYTATYPDKVNNFVALDGLLPFHQPTDKVVANLRTAADMLIDDTFKHKVYPDLGVLTDKLSKTIFYHGMDQEISMMMLMRSIRHIPSGYQFTYDKRLRYPALMRMTKDVLFPLTESWKSPILYITASGGFKIFHHPSYEEGIEFLEKQGHVELLELPGPHHIHMQNPEQVAQAITKFLGLDNDPVDEEKHPSFEFKGI